MVVEGHFTRASYERYGRGRNVVTVTMELDDAELFKLQNGLAGRRMDKVQMVINSSAVVAANPGDTPTTSVESW